MRPIIKLVVFKIQLIKLTVLLEYISVFWMLIRVGDCSSYSTDLISTKINQLLQS